MYRSWDQRRSIIRAIIAESSDTKLVDFSLTESEEIFFRTRAARAVDSLAKNTSEFRAYYALPTEKPFRYVIGVVALVVVGAIAAAVYIELKRNGDTQAYPLLAACATLAVAAIGWAVAGWISHRNTVRQNTNTLLFARFSQSPFGDALYRFHEAFGNDVSLKVTPDRLKNLREEGEDGRKSVSALVYILNYYEFICSGVLRGDLNAEIVRANIRGNIVHYYEFCEPCIKSWNAKNPRVYEHLIKVRTHYREP